MPIYANCPRFTFQGFVQFNLKSLMSEDTELLAKELACWFYKIAKLVYSRNAYVCAR